MHEPVHVKNVLPHGEPFLFVDEVLSIDMRRIVASRAIPMQEPWTHAHFPGDPLVPGVLLIEGMAQTLHPAVLSPGMVCNDKRSRWVAVDKR